MELLPLHLDFAVLSKAFEKHVRQKATLAGSTIIYAVDGQIIEEDPITLRKTVIKSVCYSNQ